MERILTETVTRMVSSTRHSRFDLHVSSPLMNATTGKAIWDHVNQSISDFHVVYGILDRSYNLLRQAVAVYEAEAYEGVALLCRSALEAAFLDFLTLEWNPGGDSILSKEPLTLSGEVREISYQELQTSMESRGLLSGKKTAVERIREDGNFSAHIASRQKKAYLKWFAEMARIDSMIRTKVGSVEEKVKAYADMGARLGKTNPTSISKERAFEDLRDTALVFLTIASAIARPLKHY